MLRGRRNQWPNEYLRWRNERKATGDRRAQHRFGVAVAIAALRRVLAQCCFDRLGLLFKRVGRHNRDLADIERVEVFLAQASREPLGQVRKEYGAESGVKQARPSGVDGPVGGHRILRGVRIIQNQRLRRVQTRVGVEHLGIASDRYRLRTLEPRKVGRIPIRLTAHEGNDIEPVALGLRSDLASELHVRTQVGDALSQRAAPPLGDEQPDQRLAATSGKLDSHVAHGRRQLGICAQGVTLPQQQVTDAAVGRSQRPKQRLRTLGAIAFGGTDNERHHQRAYGRGTVARGRLAVSCPFQSRMPSIASSCKARNGQPNG
jgi:hypothetical protein